VSSFFTAQSAPIRLFIISYDGVEDVNESGQLYIELNETRPRRNSPCFYSAHRRTHTSSSAIAERPRCKVGLFWPKVEDDILQTIYVYQCKKLLSLKHSVRAT